MRSSVIVYYYTRVRSKVNRPHPGKRASTWIQVKGIRRIKNEICSFSATRCSIVALHRGFGPVGRTMDAPSIAHSVAGSVARSVLRSVVQSTVQSVAQSETHKMDAPKTTAPKSE